MAAKEKSRALSVNSEHCRLWSPYKELHSVVNDAVVNGSIEAQADLELVLRKHRSSFTSLLETTPKNAAHRKRIQSAGKEGIVIIGGAQAGTSLLDEASIAETLILSDLFDINELEALELLLAGESQMAHYPGLTRGLVAVLLYHDGRRCIGSALRTLIQARQGRRFSTNISHDLGTFITHYTDELMKDGTVEKILETLAALDTDKMIKDMTEQRALGKPKHKHQVLSLMSETRQSLADCIFYWSCQQPFTKLQTLSLLGWIAKNLKVTGAGTLDSCGMSLLMALLYAIDVSILESTDDESSTLDLYLLTDDSFIPAIHDAVNNQVQSLKTQGQGKIDNKDLKTKMGVASVIQFAWAVTLRVVAQHPALPTSAQSCCERDEECVESALISGVFEFMRESVIKSSAFSAEEEFYVRKIHDLISSFIYQMPFKVKELRDIGDDSARIILHHQQDGSELPSSVRKDFQNFLLLIGDMYELEGNVYKLAELYWCGTRPFTAQQISLHKFVRMAGELVPPPLFVPYLNMIRGLSCSELGSIYCFNLLKANSEQASMVSWDHIFSSLHQYFASLKQEIANNDTKDYRYGGVAPPRSHQPRDITEQELTGLIAVCRLISKVTDESAEVRVAVAESQQWLPHIVLFGLVGCSVPVTLKAEIMLALASLAKSPEIAANLWQTLEISQLLMTTGGGSVTPAGGLITELENVESRLETYPMLRAFLKLIDNLCSSSGQPPESLGAGHRAPGFHPYLEFIINDVILKFSTRGYSNKSEKWQVAAGALSVLHQLLSSHQVATEHFSDQLIDLQTGTLVSEYKAPGHTILTMLLQSSPLLSVLLSVISDGLRILLQYNTDTPGRTHVEKTTLLCMKLLNLALDKQEQYLETLRLTGHTTIVSRLDKLLLNINPQTGQADHLITISRYTSMVNLLPEHALNSVCIMGTVCKQPSIQSELLSLYLADNNISREILAGLVESIEQGSEGNNEHNRCETASAAMKLILDTLSQPSPNISHFLLGFNVNKPLSQTDLQTPGVAGVYRTCLHAILSLIDSELSSPSLVELGYQIIHSLCVNKTTSTPVMRYLRTAQDFFYKHLCRIPFTVNNTSDEAEISHVIRQQTWFMKSVAIELRSTSLNKQRSHTQRLINCLLESSAAAFSNLTNNAGGRDFEMTNTTLNQTVLNMSTLAQLSYQQGGVAVRKSRLLQFLDVISFHDVSVGEIMLEQFNTASIMQVLTQCEQQQADTGLVAVNIPQVHRLLMSEVNMAAAQQGANTGPPTQREALLKEVREILQYAVEWNTIRENVHTRLQAFDSWRQVAEIILTGCPEDSVQGEHRRNVIIELLNALIKKSLQEGSLDDLISPACGVMLTLMASLRQAMFGESSDEESSTKLSLQQVLKGVLNLIVTSSGSLQRARANLYGSLLYYLQISEPPLPKSIDPLSDGSIAAAVIGQEPTNERLAKETLAVINGFGDALLEAVCRDAFDGLNVSRMLALSCLDSIIALDSSSQQVLRFVTAHGYMRHLVESLIQSDKVLLKSLNPSEPLRHLYIYESTMSLLTRLAMSAQGASALLNAGLMNKLAECAVYDAKPNPTHINMAGEDESMLDYEGFSPSIYTRYRQIMLPCLKLCQTILVSLGTENEHAANQVMRFVVSHSDVFYNTLRDETEETCESLEELSLLTAVLCRAAAYHSVSESSEDERELMYKGQVSRIQRRLGGLLTKYLLLDDWNKKIKSTEALDYSQRHQMVVYVHEIAANISCYCRNVLSNSSHDTTYCRVLFGPSLSEAIGHRDVYYNKSAAALDYTQSSNLAPPNLGLIVVQLKQASSKILDALDEHKRLTTRLESLPDDTTTANITMSATVTMNITSPTSPTSADTRQSVTFTLQRQTHIIHLLSMIIENCLYIVWKHLDFYLVNCVPIDQDTTLFKTHHKTATMDSMRKLTDSSFNKQIRSGGDKSQSLRSSGVTRKELEELKDSTPRALNESLLAKLAEIEQCYASKRTQYGYMSALSRRLKRLINIHCS